MRWSLFPCEMVHLNLTQLSEMSEIRSLRRNIPRVWSNYPQTNGTEAIQIILMTINDDNFPVMMIILHLKAGSQVAGSDDNGKIMTTCIWTWWWWLYFSTATKRLLFEFYLNIWRVLSIRSDPYQALMKSNTKQNKENYRKWKWNTTNWSSTNKTSGSSIPG